MANGNRRPLAPVRKLFAAVLATVALFVVLFGIGMQSLAIVALGIALIVLAVGLVLVTAIRGGARAWVAGTAHVHSVSEPPASSVFGRCELQVLVDAPGVAGRLVRMRDPRVPVAKWPDVGASLPIMVAIDDPRHIRILWDEVLTHAEAAASGEDDLGPLEDDESRWPRRDDDFAAAPDDYAAAPVETIETTTADLTDELSGLRKPEPVVHHTPGGPIVVEGELVEPSGSAPPLTRRARPDPRKTRAERASREEGSGGTATATAPPPPPDVPGQRGAAGPNTEQPDDVFDQDANWAEPLFTERRVSRPATAGAGPADAAGPTEAEMSEEPGDEGESAETGMRSDAPAEAAEEPVAADNEPVAADDEALADADESARAGSAVGTEPADDQDGPEDLPAEGDGPPAPVAAAGDDVPPQEVRRGTDDDGEGDQFADLFTAYPSARPGATGATIHGVGLTFLVRDLGRSVAFYRDMLGFQEIDSGEHNAVLASGDTRMVLREIKEASAVSRRLVHLNLEVGDVMTVYEDLRAKGVRFTYPPRVVNRGVKLELWAAAFRDPDGHGIAITQWRSRETG